jgi:hypothetical protein
MPGGDAAARHRTAQHIGQQRRQRGQRAQQIRVECDRAETERVARHRERHHRRQPQQADDAPAAPADFAVQATELRPALQQPRDATPRDRTADPEGNQRRDDGAGGSEQEAGGDAVARAGGNAHQRGRHDAAERDQRLQQQEADPAGLPVLQHAAKRLRCENRVVAQRRIAQGERRRTQKAEHGQQCRPRYHQRGRAQQRMARRSVGQRASGRNGRVHGWRIGAVPLQFRFVFAPNGPHAGAGPAHRPGTPGRQRETPR